MTFKMDNDIVKRGTWANIILLKKKKKRLKSTNGSVPSLIPHRTHVEAPWPPFLPALQQPC